jgi:hypothetical protein
MLSREKFDAEMDLLRAALELRRRKYLRYFYIGIACAFLLLGTAAFCPAEVLHAIQRPLYAIREALGLHGAHAPLKPTDIVAYRLFAVICSLGLTLGPVLSYRGGHGFSVERAVFTRILGFFGDFAPAPSGGIHAADVRKAELFADPLLFYPETGAMGEASGVRVRLCDAAFFRRENGRDTLVFNGLFILCDMPYGAHLADQGLIEGDLARLAQTAKTGPSQKSLWDEKLYYGSSALYARIKEAVLSRFSKNELPSEKAYRLKYAIDPLLARAGLPKVEVAICEPFGFEYSSQRCLAAVAGQGAIFTLGSLFAPALESSRAGHIYEVMEGIGGLARHLRQGIP